MRATTNDLDYVAARLHGRRSGMAEAERLDELCRFRSIPELGGALFPGQVFQVAVDLQPQLLKDLAGELCTLAAGLTGADALLFSWEPARFQVENVKVLLRGNVTREPWEEIQKHVVSLPKELAVEAKELATSDSPAQFAQRMPEGPLRQSLEEVIIGAPEPPKLFFLEAALDRGYFRELLARARQISGKDRDLVEALVFQEVDIFHLMLVVRGKFCSGLAPECLLPFHLEETGISRARFITMLSDSDLMTAAQRAVGRAMDALPPEMNQGGEASADLGPAALEALAWNRYLHLANRAFRQSHAGLGTVLGYAGIRRVEVANLITLSEGIRAGLTPEAIRGRLTPRSHWEAFHV